MESYGQFRQPLGERCLPTAVDQPGACIGQFNDCPIPRASYGTDPSECCERTTSKSGRLESVIRDRNTGDFGQLTSAYGQTYRAIPQATDAHPMERDLADIDDAMALENLKTLKASDAMVDQMMAAANAIEDEGVNMAPGEAPYLAGAGMIASVKSQAMMQRMFAAAIRQEAARVAHDNTVRKRNAMFGSQFRTDVQTMFKK